MRPIALPAFVFIVLLLPTAAQTPQAQEMTVRRMGPPPPERVELSAPEAAVPMQSLGGRPVVNVTIDGKGPFPFIVDTGASGMVLTNSLADELHLTVLGEARVGSPTGGEPKPGRIVKIAQLELGAAKVSGIHAVATDLPTPNDGEYRGVLSPALFPQYLVIFDFPAQSLRIRLGELPAADGKEIFEYDPQDRLPSVTLDLAGTAIKAHLDTGAPHEISVPARYATTLPLAAAPTDAGKGRLIDREVALTQARLNGKARLGSLTFDQPMIVFNESLPMGNIGSAILRRLVMSIDRAHNRVRLQQP